MEVAMLHIIFQLSSRVVNGKHLKSQTFFD